VAWQPLLRVTDGRSTRGDRNGLPAPRRWLRGALEMASFVAAQPKPFDEPIDRLAMGKMRPTFQVLDAADTQTGPLGQRLLSQANRDALLAQERTK
jgi:hypothetical protein